jgi:hypothetical protein
MIVQNFGKVLRGKNWNAPSALKTPSPSNDLNWEYNIGPKDVIYQLFFCHVRYMSLPLSKASNWVARIALIKGHRVNKIYENDLGSSTLIWWGSTVWNCRRIKKLLHGQEINTRTRESVKSLNRNAFPYSFVSSSQKSTWKEILVWTSMRQYHYAPGYPFVTLSEILDIT